MPQPTIARPKITPGEWKAMHYNLCGLVDSFGVESSDGKTVCIMEKDGRPLAEVLANARAIAALPAMLAAMRDVSSSVRLGHEVAGGCSCLACEALEALNRALVAAIEGVDP